MQPSKEQIENAARLVPELVGNKHGWHVQNAEWFNRPWQPWADTEAGKADWAVLDTAVRKWFYDNQERVADSDDLIMTELRVTASADSGDLKQRQVATFAAAAAIGEHMKGVE